MLFVIMFVGGILGSALAMVYVFYFLFGVMGLVSSCGACLVCILVLGGRPRGYHFVRFIGGILGFVLYMIMFVGGILGFVLYIIMVYVCDCLLRWLPVCHVPLGPRLQVLIFLCGVCVAVYIYQPLTSAIMSHPAGALQYGLLALGWHSCCLLMCMLFLMSGCRGLPGFAPWVLLLVIGCRGLPLRLSFAYSGIRVQGLAVSPLGICADLRLAFALPAAAGETLALLHASTRDGWPLFCQSWFVQHVCE